MAFSSSLPSSCGVGRLSSVRKVRRCPRAQIFREENDHGDPVNYEASEGLRGKKTSRSIVDQNMGVLRGRMEIVRMHERLRRPQGQTEGWYYYPLENNSVKSRKDHAEGFRASLEVAELVILSFGLPIIGGTLCLCLVSLLLHLGS